GPLADRRRAGRNGPNPRWCRCPFRLPDVWRRRMIGRWCAVGGIVGRRVVRVWFWFVSRMLCPFGYGFSDSFLIVGIFVGEAQVYVGCRQMLRCTQGDRARSLRLMGLWGVMDHVLA